MKKRLASYSLRSRLVVRMGTILLMVLIILGLGAWFYAGAAANLSYDRLLTAASLSMLERVTVANRGIEIDLPYSAHATLNLAPEDRVFYSITAPDGSLLTGYDDLPKSLSKKASTSTVFFDAKYSGEIVRFIVQSRLLAEPGIGGWVSVQLGQTRRARDELAREITLAALAGLSLVIALSVLFVWLGINRALKPLSKISRELTTRATTDLVALHIHPPREVAPLVQSINNFMQRLASSLASTQNFISDCAHQIRTPLSKLQAQLDLATQADNLVDIQARLQQARRANIEVTRLTQQLLAHAMVSHRADTHSQSEVDLCQLVKLMLIEAAREQAHTNIEFALNDELKSAMIIGDAFSLNEAFRNLLDNAIKYGPANNLISVSIYKTKNQLIVSFDDEGPGIAEALRQKSLQRFSRIDSQHSGSGLGLAIAHAVAIAHQAELRLETSQCGGLRISFCFINE